ncbi:MAG TPA: hypothetical protein VEF90_17700 [Xanthobacteraceae bacterium]|nr:hypothetical protein [Xanthobacteraceae bacterium]
MSLGEEIWAIDLSKTSTGLAEGRPGEAPRFSTVRFGGKKGKRADAAEDFRDVWQRGFEWMTDRLSLGSPRAIFIEAPTRPGAFGGETNAANTLVIVGLWTALYLAARARDVMWREANAKTVRQLFIGTGALKSREAKSEAKRVCEALGWAPKNADEADAGAVWWCASRLLAPDQTPDVKAFRYSRVADDGTVKFTAPTLRRARSEAEAVFSKPRSDQ